MNIKKLEDYPVKCLSLGDSFGPGMLTIQFKKHNNQKIYEKLLQTNILTQYISEIDGIRFSFDDTFTRNNIDEVCNRLSLII